MVSEQMVKGLFEQAVTSCEGFDASQGPPIMSVQLCGGGTCMLHLGSIPKSRIGCTQGLPWPATRTPIPARGADALVEFRDMQMCVTALQFNGMELAGRQLKINHPTGHRQPDSAAVPLRAPAALLQKYRVAVSNPGMKMPTLLTDSDRRADRKQRELFVGNLVIGSVTSQMLASYTATLAPPLRAGPSPHTAAAPFNKSDAPFRTSLISRDLLPQEMLFSEPLRTIPGNEVHAPVIEAKAGAMSKTPPVGRAVQTLPVPRNAGAALRFGQPGT